VTGAEKNAVTPLYAALTSRGKVLLGGAAVLVTAGLILRYPELIGLGAAGVVAVLAAVAAVARAPAVQVERVISPARVARGGQASACIRVRNDSRRSLPSVVARDLAGAAAVTFPVPRLRPGQEYEARMPLPTARRGVVPSGPLLVDRDDAFGLAHRTLNTGDAGELYVRPRAVELPEIAASLARSVDGPQSDTTMEGTLAFHALREYVPGDELRHVHWRASAHAGKLVVKQHVDTAHASLAVVLDVAVLTGEDGGRGRRRRPAAGGDADGLPPGLAEAFEVAVDCAASIATIAAAQRQPLRLMNTAGESLLPGSTRRRGGCTADDVLDALTRVKPVPGGVLPSAGSSPGGRADPLPDVLRRLSTGGRGSLAVVISTRPMGWLADSLRLVAGCYARVLAVHAIDGTVPPDSAIRTGRVLWVSVRRPDELAGALLRARAAA
jgi:uncharacterized protein (DUF58 family)